MVRKSDKVKKKEVVRRKGKGPDPKKLKHGQKGKDYSYRGT